MKEYRVVASIYDDLHMSSVVKRPMLKELGLCTSVYTIKCDFLEEIPDLFLNVCGDECDKMKDCIYWYVDEGNGWVLTDL